jgi:hypothetical protein
MQREIDEMKEQENNSLWCDSPHQNSVQHKRTPRENFFMGNGISSFADPESPLSLGLQKTPWPTKYKPVSLLKYNGYGHSRKFIMSYEAAINSAGGDDVALAKSFIIACEGLDLNWYSYCLHIQSAAGLISRQNSFRHFKCFLKRLQSHRTSSVASKETGRHYRAS